MKKLWVGCGWLSNKGKFFGLGLLVFACMISANLVHSQTLMLGGGQTAPPDSIVQIAAESQGLQLVSTADLPRGGTFWWVMPGCSAIPMPCPPQNPNAIIYQITDTAFLVDQTGGAVTVNTHRLGMQTTTTSTVDAALSAQADAVVNLIVKIQTEDDNQQMRMMLRSFGMDDGAPSPGDGGSYGDTNSFGYFFNYTFDTNQLWLEITNVSNGWSGLNLHNATNQVYAIWGTTNLLTPMANWNVEMELWSTDINCQPFAVQNLDLPYLFFRAEDWTGVDSDGDGIPDWWSWQYFGAVNVNATNLDSYGNTLLYDYQQGLDPNVVVFSIRPIQYVNTPSLVLPLNIFEGIPFYMAVLVNDYDTNDAVWVPYRTNLTANLSGGDGNYFVKVGLRGKAADSVQTWEGTSLVLATVSPVITITNPSTLTVSNTTINLQGFANETLHSVSFDVSNASETLTNQNGLLTGRYYDDSLFAYTTNYFTCPNVNLTSGSNWITIHATDLAGNTTDLNLALNCAASQPALNVIWPADGLAVSGNSFTLQAQVNNSAAIIVASIVDASGNTNTVKGLVENNGMAWVKNLPLGTGNNTVTVTAGLGSGVTNTQTFTVIGNDIGLVMDPLTQFNQSKVTVTGSVGDPTNDCVFVNNVQAYYTDDFGDWEADNVPVSAGGTAAIKVEVYVGDPVLIGTLTQFVPQPVAVQIKSYQKKEHTENSFGDSYLNQFWNYGYLIPEYERQQRSYTISSLKDYQFNWTDGVGGTKCDVGFDDNIPGAFDMQQSIGTEALAFQAIGDLWESANVNIPPWSRVDKSGTNEVDEGPWRWVDSNVNFYSGTLQDQISTRVQVLAPGGQAGGQTNVYLVRFASVSLGSIGNYTLDGVNWPPEAFEICNQSLINTGETNTSGINASNAVWGITAVAAPAGQNVEVTPVFVTPPQENWDYVFDMQACQLYPPVADLNRDGQITLDGSDTATPATPLRFWANDASESGDVTSGSDTVPGSSSPNYTLNKVNGRCDLINFFPVALCLSNVMQLLPPTNGWEYHLSQADSAVKFVYTSLTPTNAFDYLTNVTATAGYGVNGDEAPQSADTLQVLPSSTTGTKLDNNWLAQIQNNGGNGVILMEGAAATTQPLMLELWRNGQKMGGVPLYISISGVEQMYRWLNLRDSFTVSGETQPAISYQTRSGQPSNFPDSASDGRQVIYVHGFNITEQAARAEISQAFKRLWQSRSKAMFTGVTWYGDENYLDVLGTGWPGTSLDYYANVRNAFLTAPALANAVASLPGAHKFVIAHSLGNMVVSSAIVDNGLNVEKYFAIDAAVAMEAYDGSVKDLGMVNPNAGSTFTGWPNYDQRLWSTEWYQLFDSSDGRSGLTWRNRFGVIPNLYNFYSSGEEVLENPTYQTLPPLGKEWIWVSQEMRKGTGLFDILDVLHLVNSDPEAGWALNTHWFVHPDPAHPAFGQARSPTQATITDISDDALRADPFCRVFNDSNLTGSQGSSEAANPQVRAVLLGVGLPALSHATGANFVEKFGPQNVKNFDMSAHGSVGSQNPGFETGWPASRPLDANLNPRWLHSDLKDVAYPFNHKLHDKLVELGGLYEN